MRRTLAGLAVVVVMSLAIGSPSLATVPGAASTHRLTAAQRTTLAAGLQTSPKSPASGGTAPPSGANPVLSYTTDPTTDLAAWARSARAGALARADSHRLAVAQAAAEGTSVADRSPVYIHQEHEAAGVSGSNDGLDDPEFVNEFVSPPYSSHNRVSIHGDLAAVTQPATRSMPAFAEDNGSIPLAGDTGIAGVGSVTTTGVLGDGPHGTTGDNSNDFDFYQVSADAGTNLIATTGASPDGTDTVIALYDADGTVLASDDDGGPGVTSLLDFPVPTTGVYYVMVAGFAISPLPTSPFDSGSGDGGAITGAYDLSISVQSVDRDVYTVRLTAGTVLGLTATGSADNLAVYSRNGTLRIGAAAVDYSAYYPANSPLPGGGNTTLAYVVPTTADYRIQVTGATTGPYQVAVEGYRSRTETQTPPTLQTIYLDFSGGPEDTTVWGGQYGVQTLSPFSAYLPALGIPTPQTKRVIRAIAAVVRENMRTDLILRGDNPLFDLRVVTSLDHPGLAHKPNVSRIVIGGGSGESGIPSIATAQDVDPGNFGLNDSGIVQMDGLSSDDTSDGSSLNTYLTPASDRIAFVSQAVGNLASQVAGQLVGSYHTDSFDAVPNLEDYGLTGFSTMYGVGPDGIGGTADDVDVDFGSDAYTPLEGFTGLENTFATTDWAYTYRPTPSGAPVGP